MAFWRPDFVRHFRWPRSGGAHRGVFEISEHHYFRPVFRIYVGSSIPAFRKSVGQYAKFSGWPAVIWSVSRTALTHCPKLSRCLSGLFPELGRKIIDEFETNLNRDFLDGFVGNWQHFLRFLNLQLGNVLSLAPIRYIAWTSDETRCSSCLAMRQFLQEKRKS